MQLKTTEKMLTKKAIKPNISMRMFIMYSTTFFELRGKKFKKKMREKKKKLGIYMHTFVLVNELVV